MRNEIFAIGIPTINRLDLLDETVEKYLFDFPSTLIILVDNGNQHIESIDERVIVHTMVENIGVAASWNFICKQIFYQYGILNAVIINDDVYWGKREDTVKEFIEKNKRKPFIKTMFEWCNFILPVNTYEKIGEFDAAFHPAYWEDKDYEYRMKLAGISPTLSVFMNPQTYRNSMSIEKDRSLDKNFDKNKWRYINKWGGIPGSEKHTIPFNQSVGE